MYATADFVEARTSRALAMFALIWLGIGLVWLMQGDAVFAHWLAAPPFNTRWRGEFRLLSDWGMAGFYLFFLGVLAHGLVRGDRRLRQIGLAYLYAQILGSVLLVHLIKAGCGRPRPGVESVGAAFCPGPSFQSAFHSFPSSHSTDLMISALFVAIFVQSRGAAALAVLLAISVALSRVVLGSHHMSDVLAGALLGAMMVWLVLNRYLLPRWRTRG
jgi:undecaprenyl-diphosphatase